MSAIAPAWRLILFETYVVSIVGDHGPWPALLYGVIRPKQFLIYPLMIGGVCIVTSVIGTFFVKLGAARSIMGALYKGFIVCAVFPDCAVPRYQLRAGIGHDV